MLLLQSQSRYLLQVLTNRIQSLEKGVELDCLWVEFDDVRFHVQSSTKNPHILLLSLSLPVPPPEALFVGGLPFGAIEAIKATYGVVAQIHDPPRDAFNLTMKLNFLKLAPDEENRHAFLVKLASVREVVLGAPLKVVLGNLGSRSIDPDMDRLVALVHWPKESFFLVPECSEGFMHTRMRRRVESLIEALDRAKPGFEEANRVGTKTSFMRLSLRD
ncbi:hypothetical protein Droror1_Dr00018123 [Drosera rotundifolia]